MSYDNSPRKEVKETIKEDLEVEEIGVVVVSSRELRSTCYNGVTSTGSYPTFAFTSISSGSIT